MKRKEIPVALLPDLKFRYECTDEPIHDLAKCAGMSPDVFRKRAKELGWKAKNLDRRGRRQMILVRAVEEPFITPDEFAQGCAGIAARDEPADAASLARRIRGAIERELAAIEVARRTIDPARSVQTESITRVLTGLTRALQEARQLEVAALRPVTASQQQDSKAEAIDDDAVPTDRDELRRALAQRIADFVASQTDR
jgi:hypothetical protein